MSNDRKSVTINILDKPYKVACPLGEQVALLASARHLDQKMREIRDNSRVIGLDRVAVMAALNMTNELLAKDADDSANTRYNKESVDRMHQKLDDAINRFGN